MCAWLRQGRLTGSAAAGARPDRATMSGVGAVSVGLHDGRPHPSPSPALPVTSRSSLNTFARVSVLPASSYKETLPSALFCAQQ